MKHYVSLTFYVGSLDLQLTLPFNLFYHQFMLGGLLNVMHQADKPKGQTGLQCSGGTSLFSIPLLASSLERGHNVLLQQGRRICL